MDVGQLREALGQHDADPGTVLGLVRAKRRARTRRRVAVGAALVVAVLLVPVGWLATHREQGGPASVGGAAANACDPVPLGERLRQVLDLGASVVVARGELTGQVRRDGPLHREMTLTGVRTLGGPVIAEGSVVWVETPQLPPLPDDTARGNPGPLWGPGGALFGFVFPQAVSRSPLGLTVMQSPVVGDQVVFSISGGCWNPGSIGGAPFHGKLTEIPGSGTYARAEEAGFTAVPLTTVEQLLPR